MSSVKKSIETAESAQAAGAGTGEDAVREAQRMGNACRRIVEQPMAVRGDDLPVG